MSTTYFGWFSQNQFDAMIEINKLQKYQKHHNIIQNLQMFCIWEN